MPSYLYFCEVSNEEFEETHSINEELKECSICKKLGKEAHLPKRLISTTSFVLVGGGWAKDRYS
jgi:predicted nucleic acid-binding Zn ribbon protein